MPVYTYACTNCDAMIEKRQSFSDAPLTTCDLCGAALRKVIHPVGLVFKGSGWYVTDSRPTTPAESAANGSDAKAKPASKDGAGDGARPDGGSAATPASGGDAPAAKDAAAPSTPSKPPVSVDASAAA